MHVMDALRTGAFVKIVDILGAEKKVIPHCVFKRREGTMSGIWLSSEGIAPAHRVETPYEFGVRMPRLGSGDLLDTMTAPQPS